ncbi:MAG TPA: glycerol-3-phosphate dehydrogenase C-terminal domain-containing protein, partial [Candidatus Krumholzibacterium sp.]|nr:glycerol-3-phosphate dehydrogenase C-terminal domain-containing protein [Candidatus Krumholzibacterium sp.]
SLLMSGLGLALRPRPVFSRDVCFVVSRSISSEFALACQTRTQDADAILHRGGRHLFLAPWREHTLVGVWHGMYEGSPDGVNVTRKELQAFLDETNEAYPGISLSLADVTMVNTGLILFSENKPDAAGIRFGKRSILIDHGKNDGIEGVVTLIGVRATTARGMAEKAVDLAFRKMGVRPPKSKTATIPIYGGEIDDFENILRRITEQRPYGLVPQVIHSLAHNYGSEYGGVLRQIDRDPGLAQRVPGSSVLKAEIIHAIREEMAQTLGDVVFRRTDLATAGHPGEQALATCADLMARESGWDDERVRKELAEVKKEFPDYGSEADPEKIQVLSPAL